MVGMEMKTAATCSMFLLKVREFVTTFQVMGLNNDPFGSLLSF